MPDPLLTIRSVEKSFGATQVLRGITLDVAAGEFLTILGESGSGKTTLLRLIAGFEQLDSGVISIDGQRIDPLPAPLTRAYCIRILLRWAQPTRPSSRRRLTWRLSKNRSKS